ncbi:MAG: hypothetical protein ACETWK_11475 [Candidatus Aminicenantaceae bacterium]
MMKRIFLHFLVSLLIASIVVSFGFSQTAKEIREKMIEAEGGKAAFESVKDMTLSGAAELIQQGLSGPITVYKKEPDKRRLDFEVYGLVITQAYDGKIAWQINPQTGSTEEMSEQDAAEMKRESLPIVSALYPEKYGFTYEYKGKEKIEEKEYYLLEITYPDGFKTANYVDPETYLTYKIKAKTTGPMGNEVEVEQFPSDYKKVEGMVLAHSFITYYNGEEFLRITIEEVKFNTELEDSLFKMSE